GVGGLLLLLVDRLQLLIALLELVEPVAGRRRLRLRECEGGGDCQQPHDRHHPRKWVNQRWAAANHRRQNTPTVSSRKVKPFPFVPAEAGTQTLPQRSRP